MAQVAREKALTKFREDKIQVLVCTDVAARGIDVQGVSHVVNYSCPEDDKIYIHRIGRTGRAGASGIAITFVDWADLHRWKMINKALDLPFDDPAETYSTSEHLFHDQGIAPGTKSRLVDPAPREKQERPDRGERSSDRPARSRDRDRDRNRNRTRGGKPVDGAAEGSGSTEQTSGGERSGASGNRRRRRRRTRSSGPAPAAD
jgi:superfamily II DNA/RNA helicase